MLVSNDTPAIIENVTAQVTLVDSTGVALASKTALLPLDILPPGASLPLSVLFPPPLPLDAKPQVQILTAIRLLPGDSRYLPTQVQETLTEVSWSGRSAEVHGKVRVQEGSGDAAVVWIAAVAYDASGAVVGWRRWESSGGLTAGSSLPFELMISSVAGPIERVDLTVEARP